MSSSEFDVFISYSRSDQQIVDSLQGFLKEKKIKYWIDRDAIHLGDSFQSQISKAIKNARVFVLILSENSNSSQNVIKEARFAEKNQKKLAILKLGKFQINEELELMTAGIHYDVIDPTPNNDDLVSFCLKVQTVLNMLNLIFEPENDTKTPGTPDGHIPIDKTKESLKWKENVNDVEKKYDEKNDYKFKRPTYDEWINSYRIWKKKMTISISVLIIYLLFPYVFFNNFLNLTNYPLFFIFHLPLFFLICVIFALLISYPFKEYKLWLSSDNINSSVNIDSIDINNFLILTFVLVNLSEKMNSSYQVKAPNNMLLGELFHFFITEYNHRYPEKNIEYGDVRKTSGCFFYKKTKFFRSKKYLTPFQTIKLNKINDREIIYVVPSKLHHRPLF